MLLTLAYITMHYCEAANYLYGLNICICFHSLFSPKYCVLTSILTKKIQLCVFPQDKKKYMSQMEKSICEIYIFHVIKYFHFENYQD